MSTHEQHLEVKADKDSFDEVMSFLSDTLEAAGCPPSMMKRIAIAAEEIFVNVASYAYDERAAMDGTDTMTVSCITDDEDNEVDITFIDHGVPYDPLAKEDPDITASVEERQIGGLGIFMVKEMMDEVAYSYDGRNNKLVIRKGWDV